MLNRVILMGRLVADPELRTTNSGTSVTRIRVAVDRNFARQGEEKKTDFIDCEAWRNTAEFICKYFAKGRMIALEGALKVDNYTDKEGNKRTSVYVGIDNVYFADSKNSSASAPQSRPAASEQPGSLPETGYSSGSPEDFAVVEDDGELPF